MTPSRSARAVIMFTEPRHPLNQRRDRTTTGDRRPNFSGNGLKWLPCNS